MGLLKKLRHAPPFTRSLPMAAAETMKKTVEQFSTASNQAFKDGVEKSLSALAEANTHSKRNLEAVVASVTAATKGAEALGAEAFAYSKKAAEDQVAAAKSLAGAKSVQEAMELQTTWAKSALEAYIAQMSKASEIVSASIKDSMKPLNERVSAAVEKFQAAR
jgi:phasin family protein